jgi:hypothetical protein
MGTEETTAIPHIRTQDLAKDASMKGKTVLFTGASRGMGASRRSSSRGVGRTSWSSGTTMRGALPPSMRFAVPVVRRHSCARTWATPRTYAHSPRRC